MNIELLFDGGNGASTEKEAYGSYRIITSAGDNKIIRVSFGTGYTNNEAEYKTLIHALTQLDQLLFLRGIPNFDVDIIIQGDSMLVKEQIGTYRLPYREVTFGVFEQDWTGWKVKVPHLLPLRDEARRLLATFRSFDYQHIPRKEVVKVLGH